MESEIQENYGDGCDRYIYFKTVEKGLQEALKHIKN
jgi:hypothetical protein